MVSTHCKLIIWNVCNTRDSLWWQFGWIPCSFSEKNVATISLRRGLMASALIPRSSGPDSSPAWGHCIVFSHSASLHPGVYKLWAPEDCWGNLTNCGGVTCDGLASCPEGEKIPRAASCYRNRDKLRQHEPVSSMASHIPLKLTCRCN